MKTMTYPTFFTRSSAWAKGLTLATLAAGAWALSANNAHARGDDVYWSIGVDSPGVSVGVSNAPPVVVHQRPVYVDRRPVVIHQPAPVVIHQPYPYVQPVVVPRPVYYSGWGYGPRWDDRHDRRHGRWEHRRHDRHDRYDRDDRYDRGDRHDHRRDDDDRGGDRRGDGRR